MTEPALDVPRDKDPSAGREPSENEHVYSVQVLDRAFRILELLAERPSRVAELGSELGLHRSTVFRLVSNLEQWGFVRKDSAGSTYSLGPKFFQLGAKALGEELPLELLRPLLVELTDVTGQTSQLWMREHMEALCVDQAEPVRDVRIIGKAGARLPLNYGAVSKVLLAFGPTSVLDQLLSQPLPTHKPGAVTDPEVLRAELDAVRAAGYATSEQASGIGCTFLAAPVFNGRGVATLAVCALAPNDTIQGDGLLRLADAVCRYGRELSLLLGYDGTNNARTGAGEPNSKPGPRKQN